METMGNDKEIARIAIADLTRLVSNVKAWHETHSMLVPLCDDCRRPCPQNVAHGILFVEACLYNGFRFIGIDLHPEHLTIARKRIRYVLDKEPLLALLKPDGMDSDSHNKKLIDNRPM